MYRTEQTSSGTDIVIDGFEAGIADSPYMMDIQTAYGNLTRTGLSDSGSNNRNNGLYDSNTSLSSGSNSMLITTGGSTSTVMVALAPYVAPIINGSFLLKMI